MLCSSSELTDLRMKILLLSPHAGRTYDAAVSAPFHLWSWRKIPWCCTVLFQLGFPVSLTGSVAPSHCLALQKEPKQRGEGEKRTWQQRRKGRVHDKGKRQGEVAKELRRRVGGNTGDGQFERCWIIWQLKWEKIIDIKTFQTLVQLYSSKFFKEQEHLIYMSRKENWQLIVPSK